MGNSFSFTAAAITADEITSEKDMDGCIDGHENWLTIYTPHTQRYTEWSKKRYPVLILR